MRLMRPSWEGAAAVPDDVPSDAELWAQGDEHAFGELYDRHREWATCALTETRSDSLSLIRTTPGDQDSALVVGGHQSGSEFVLAGRTTSAAKTVEVSDRGGPPVTANVADGHFIVRFPVYIGDDQKFSPANLSLVARNADGKIVYEGGIG
jgi:hypothetical protein